MFRNEGKSLVIKMKLIYFFGAVATGNTNS